MVLQLQYSIYCVEKYRDITINCGFYICLYVDCSIRVYLDILQ